MKRLALPALIFTACVAAFVLGVRAGQNLLIGSLAAVNNTTTNSPSFQIGTYSLPNGTMTIQSAGLTATNTAPFNVQVSVDNTNFLTLLSYNLPATNAGTYTFNPAFIPSPLYLRVSETTTANVTNSVTYSF